MKWVLPDIVRDRYVKLHKACQEWKDRPESMPLALREDFATWLAGTFTDFRSFACIGMKYLGFDLSEIQADIAEFMQYGRSKRMIQAQRGQAKSTLAALYIIWRLIHNPKLRALIVSGGGAQASDVALLIQRIISNWSILCWLRPDVSKGDRVSIENFDVHYALKGIDKSASIACVGITASLQGKRADLILADDVETQKNSLTQPAREQLLLLTKEFAAICITGEIMYLGTPQTKDSVYRSLPSRGYDVRVWTGRYPTDEELARYGLGVQVAPMIMERLRLDPTLQTGGGITGKRGKPTDPEHISEDILQEKELEYGEEGFTLQYMLDTTLSDALRTKVKLSDMLVLGVGKESVPEQIEYSADPTKVFKDLTPPLSSAKMYWGVPTTNTYIPFEHKIMTLDPSGAGGDEMGFAVGGATKAFIYLLSVGGFIGGTTEANINKVIAKMIEYNVKSLLVEKNMGHGAVTQLIIAQIDKLKLKADTKSQDEEFLAFLSSVGLTHSELYTALQGIGVGDYTVTGQKERRIIDTISPVTRRHKLVVATSAIQEDWEYCLQHSAEKREQYSAFVQLANITYDRNSLVHDDRADAIQALIKHLQGFLAIDAERAAVRRNEEDFKKWWDNPMDRPSYTRSSRGRHANQRNNRFRR